MKPTLVLKHKFVEYIPGELEEGIIYVSTEFATASHMCICGCGLEVVTPFSPTDWKLIFDGVSISLDPSIGNWSFPCQSHYWIKHNKIVWSYKWSQERIDAGRKNDSLSKRQYFEDKENMVIEEINATDKTNKTSLKKGWWLRLKNWLFNR